MYYKKHTEIEPLPEEIKLELISIVDTNMKFNIPMVAWYKQYETKNKNSVAYVNPGEELLETNGKETGGVGFYGISPEVNQKICDFYNKPNNPLADNFVYVIQVVTGGEFVGPHIDDPAKRMSGLLYLLKSGGSNVRTRWYEIKEEYKKYEKTAYANIPYSRLNMVEDHCLEEDTWHWLDFSQIHSVENQESLRIALYGFKR